MTALSARRVALAVLVATVLVLGCKKKKPDPANDDNPSGAPGSGNAPGASAPPAGWSEARDTVGGFKLYVFGRVQMLDAAKAKPEYQALQMSRMTNNLRSEDTAAKVYTFSFVPPSGSKFGTAPEELYAGLFVFRKDLEKFEVVLAKEPMKLGGRPALKVVTKGRDLTAGVKSPLESETPDWVKESRKKQDAERTTYFITATATRVIIVQAQTAGEPDPAEFKILTESFAFL